MRRTILFSAAVVAGLAGCLPIPHIPSPPSRVPLEDGRPSVQVVVDIAPEGEFAYYLPHWEVMTVEAALWWCALPDLFQHPSKYHVWVNRPRPSGEEADLLTVDWARVTKDTKDQTNYILQPGDRIYVKPALMIGDDRRIGKFGPVETACRRIRQWFDDLSP